MLELIAHDANVAVRANPAPHLRHLQLALVSLIEPRFSRIEHAVKVVVVRHRFTLLVLVEPFY